MTQRSKDGDFIRSEDGDPIERFIAAVEGVGWRVMEEPAFRERLREKFPKAATFIEEWVNNSLAEEEQHTERRMARLREALRQQRQPGPSAPVDQEQPAPPTKD